MLCGGSNQNFYPCVLLRLLASTRTPTEQDYNGNASYGANAVYAPGFNT